MSVGEEYSLRWNNHQLNFISVFKNLLDLEELVDVTLSVEGFQIKAHKVILSACSPFFQMLFKETPCKHPVVLLNEIKFVDLKKIVDFMYCGEIDVPDEQLADILEVAETLQIKGLYDPIKKQEETTAKRKRRKSQIDSVNSEDLQAQSVVQNVSGSELNGSLQPIDFLETSQYSIPNGLHSQNSSVNYIDSGRIEDDSTNKIDMNIYGHSIGVVDTSPNKWNSESKGQVRRRYNKSHNNGNLLAAMEAVKSGALGFCKAAKLYGVNNRTLWLEYKKRGYKSKRPPVRPIKSTNSKPS